MYDDRKLPKRAWSCVPRGGVRTSILRTSILCPSLSFRCHSHRPHHATSMSARSPVPIYDQAIRSSYSSPIHFFYVDNHDNPRPSYVEHRPRALGGLHSWEGRPFGVSSDAVATCKWTVLRELAKLCYPHSFTYRVSKDALPVVRHWKLAQSGREDDMILSRWLCTGETNLASTDLSYRKTRYRVFQAV